MLLNVIYTMFDKPQHLMYGNDLVLFLAITLIFDKPQHIMYGNTLPRRCFTSCISDKPQQILSNKKRLNNYLQRFLFSLYNYIEIRG